jgi:hypothetical protein
MYVDIRVKRQPFLYDFNWSQNLSTNCSKNLEY